MARKADGQMLMIHDFDEASRTIFLKDLSEHESESDRTSRFLKALMLLDNAAPNGDKPITVILSHDGGSVYDGMAIFDAIKSAVNPVYIRVMGSAQSMGAIILQAGDERSMMKHSVLMIHHGEQGGEGHKKQVESMVDFSKRYDPKLDKILLDRIKEKKPRFTKKQLDDLLNFDKYFTAEEALEYGLIDSIEDVDNV